MKRPTILIVGTVDTKSDEIGFMHEQVLAAGGQSLIMDVGVLAKGSVVPDIANTEVAMAAGVTLQQVMDSGDENSAMALMAQGASKLASQLQQAGRIDGLLVLGGTMGTDLALDVASSLPLGVPKVGSMGSIACVSQLWRKPLALSWVRAVWRERLNLSDLWWA